MLNPRGGSSTLEAADLKSDKHFQKKLEKCKSYQKIANAGVIKI